MVMEFGKYKYATQAGIQWHLPYPIQTHELINTSRIHSVKIGHAPPIGGTLLKDS